MEILFNDEAYLSLSFSLSFQKKWSANIVILNHCCELIRLYVCALPLLCDLISSTLLFICCKIIGDNGQYLLHFRNCSYPFQKCILTRNSAPFLIRFMLGKLVGYEHMNYFESHDESSIRIASALCYQTFSSFGKPRVPHILQSQKYLRILLLRSLSCRANGKIVLVELWKEGKEYAKYTRRGLHSMRC